MTCAPLLAEHDDWQRLDNVLRVAKDSLERMGPTGDTVPDDFGFHWAELDLIFGEINGARRAANAAEAADAVNQALREAVLDTKATSRGVRLVPQALRQDVLQGRHRAAGQMPRA